MEGVAPPPFINICRRDIIGFDTPELERGAVDVGVGVGTGVGAGVGAPEVGVEAGAPEVGVAPVGTPPLL
jgi:hypothetical protein